MKANLNQVFTRKKNGRLRPTWRYLLGRLLGSLEGKERGGEERTTSSKVTSVFSAKPLPDVHAIKLERKSCPKCLATGRWFEAPCDLCKGIGYFKNSKERDAALANDSGEETNDE